MSADVTFRGSEGGLVPCFGVDVLGGLRGELLNGLVLVGKGGLGLDCRWIDAWY